VCLGVSLLALRSNNGSTPVAFSLRALTIWQLFAVALVGGVLTVCSLWQSP
jgi:hypothetical protein